MNQLGGYDIEDLKVGMSATFAKAITGEDILLFAGASGDENPVHLDEDYAQSTPFGGRIAHGMLTASIISAAIANRLPGPGSVYLSQDLRFRSPVRPGEIVQATVTVQDVLKDRRRASLVTVCRVDGRIVIEGSALVMVTSSAQRDAAKGEKAESLI